MKWSGSYLCVTDLCLAAWPCRLSSKTRQCSSEDHRSSCSQMLAHDFAAHATAKSVWPQFDIRQR